MNILKMIDGNKTYITAVAGGILAIIHFLANGDFSLGAELQLSQNAALLAAIAALRHGIQKVPYNQGNFPGGIQKTVPAIVLFLMLSGSAFAQTANVSVSSALRSINIPTTIGELKEKAVIVGYFYNWKDDKIQVAFTYPVIVPRAFSWGTVDYLDVGYASPNVLVAGPGINVNIAAFAQKIGIKFSPGLKVILRNASAGSAILLGLEEIGGRNRFTGGPGGYIKIAW